MIDKILLKIFGYIDNLTDKIANLFPKPKKRKKKKKCKGCNCKCHCKDELHLHSDNQELCTCDNCQCK